MSSKIISFVTSSYVRAIVAEKIIKEKIKETWDKREESTFPQKDPDDLINVLEKHLTKNLTIRKVVEDKAKSNLIGITLSISVLFTGFGFILKNETFMVNFVLLKYIIIGLLLLSVLYLLLSGWSALKCLIVEKLYDLSIDEEFNLSEREKLVRYLSYVKMNNYVYIIKTNFLSVSQKALQYGIVLLGFVIILNSFVLFLHDKSSLKVSNKQSIKSEVKSNNKTTKNTKPFSVDGKDSLLLLK